ncbi:hypothetical protein A2774_03220 [Candidatus Roizmanbacteria bacterium RIFCSPHIGHO2_01_FULL_39_12c]|uniref:Glycosyltransferase 2-like domain-containing protein n=1 Tax=Candidatus Roizmanbacteria bacterium RIFCSPHIGHO2_01_FULL_39_12c TaxID=1802031 RepID=A0A1F7GFL5_9BACT|nr:MAG: hypothetical protein A2774_03220 [Candidatus Roizmanbacteria bacterium RIFCSPHIGHO2_01_FULL_39_12c]
MKQQNKSISVSIGIPAYNEGHNIRHVLLDVLSQKTTGWKLTEILVHCDGCTDDTVEKAKSVKSKLIKVIVSHSRMGKTFRLQQMFSRFNSDVLVIVDADVKLADDHVITHLVETLSRDEKIMLVSGNVRPFPPTTFFQKAVYTTFNVFDKTRNAIKNGNNIFTCGALLALRKDFARNIKFPRIFNEDAFIYLTCKSSGYKFQHSSRAVIFYKLPLTLKDYLRQLFRSDTKAVGVELDKYFPGLVQKELRRPLPVYLKALLETFVTNPVGTATMFFVRTVCYPLFPIITSKYKLSWFTASSTHQ